MQKQEWSIGLYNEFVAELNRAGFFKRRYGYYLLLSSLLLAVFTLSIYWLFTIDSIGLQLGNAALFALVSVQLGMLGHDLSHNQVFKNRQLNKIFAKFSWGLALGLSESKWYVTHNTHHKEVNHVDHDPDMAMPFIFDREQFAAKRDGYITLRRFQHILFFVVLPLVYPIYVLRSFVHNFKNIDSESLFEILLMVIHYVLFFWLIFSNLAWLSGVLFILVFSLVSGLYMGLVFAPNHKGMEMVPAHEKVKWYHQIICTRNLHANSFTFHATGGLNYQIEHHLFTNMPRINYPKVAPLVKDFCAKHGLPYHETSWAGSVVEMYDALYEMQAELLSH